ncbi:hypothetical protein OPV22_022406 [Ensete ventricosum]|uniref:Uncharacterized protein n=1 Tax=Ensete ventricosum TaxID=4639 RepID=A0AAV8QPB7_ENSVE|nr:hypothetical protein OPV22_022406 [Ensete ventricosum]
MLPAVRRGTDDLRSSGGDIAVRRPTHGGLLQAPWRGLQAQFHRPTGFQVQFQFGIGPGFELLIVFSYSERGLLMYDRSTSQDVTVDAHELLVPMRLRTGWCSGLLAPPSLHERTFLISSCSQIRSFLPSFLPSLSTATAATKESGPQWERCCAGGRCRYVPQRDHVQRQPSLRHIQL